MDVNEKLNLLNLFIKRIKKINNVNFDINTTLSELDLDSLDIVELQLMFEDETGVSTTDPTTPILTVKDLLSLVP